MPKAFDACVKSGGRVRTERLGKGKYRHVCFKDGKRYNGYVKERKKAGNKLKQHSG